MKKLAFLQMLLLPLAGLLQDIGPVAANDRPVAPARAEVADSATAALQAKLACNPWSTSYWGDVRITSQAEADGYACYRRIIGTLVIAPSTQQPIRMPNLRAVFGDVRVIAGQPLARDTAGKQALSALLPNLEDVRGAIALQ